MIKKIIGRRRLQDLPVNVVDKSRTSRNYFQITEFPRKLTAGKNIIKLRAKGNVLVPDSVIHTEILDVNEKPIYHEILNYVEQHMPKNLKNKEYMFILMKMTQSFVIL